MIIAASSGITPQGRVKDIWLRVEGDQVVEIGSGLRESADVNIEGTLIPGFVDIHCHGGAGFYFSDIDRLNIESAIQLHRSHGTRRILASLVTADLQVLTEQINRLSLLYREGLISGIHLEGPYLSPARAGAHDLALLRTPKISEIQALLEAGAGSIKMITIAPELEGAIDAIKLITSNGVIASIGHTDGDAEDMKRAIDAGASLVTHFHNAMQKFNGTKETASDYLLRDSELPLEMILDGIHLPEDVSLTLSNNYSSRTIAVTDAMSAAGCGDGQYAIGNLDVIVQNRVARLDSNGALAGSTLTMDRAFINLLESGCSVEDSVRMTSFNAAEILKINNPPHVSFGPLADILVLSSDSTKIDEIGAFL